MSTWHYYPGVFDVADQHAAKKVILTDEGPNADTQTRWTLETPYVLEMILDSLAPGNETLLLDYGCGIGRVAKELIQETGCSVIGVDTSASMRSLAAAYVQSDRFVVLSPAQFDMLVDSGLRVNAAISIWVLQHCFAPQDDVRRIRRSLAEESGAFVLNMLKRAVPAANEASLEQFQFAWASDDIDVAEILHSAFHVVAEGRPERNSVPNMADAGAFWMHLRA